MNYAKKMILVDSNTSLPERASQTSKALNELDKEIQHILNSDLPDDIKAVQYISALKKYRAFDYNRSHRLDETIEKEKDLETRLLQSIPNSQSHLAKRIYDHLKDNNITFTSKGELIHNQTPIIGSNIIDLVHDLLKTSNKEIPTGWNEFAEILKQTNLPKMYIQNTQRKNYLHPKVVAKRARTPYATPDTSPMTPTLKKKKNTPPMKSRIALKKIAEWQKKAEGWEKL